MKKISGIDWFWPYMVHKSDSKKRFLCQTASWIMRFFIICILYIHVYILLLYNGANHTKKLIYGIYIRKKYNNIPILWKNKLNKSADSLEFCMGSIIVHFLCRNSPGCDSEKPLILRQKGSGNAEFYPSPQKKYFIG